MVASKAGRHDRDAGCGKAWLDKPANERKAERALSNSGGHMVKQVNSRTAKNDIALELMKERNIAVDCKVCQQLLERDEEKTVQGAHSHEPGCCKNFQAKHE